MRSVLRSLTLPLLSSLLVAAAIGCAPGTGGDAGPDAGEVSDAIDSYSAGMMKMGEDVHVVLVSAEPGPPDVGNNTWTLRVTDMSDGVLPNASVSVAPFMPEHAHGTSPADFAGAATENESEYTVGPFDLFMPGTWEMTVSVTADGGIDDEVLFRFKIVG